MDGARDWFDGDEGVVVHQKSEDEAAIPLLFCHGCERVYAFLPILQGHDHLDRSGREVQGNREWRWLR